MSGEIRVEQRGDGSSIADKTELRGMSRSDQSEGKWRKKGQDRVEKSDQGGQDRGGEIIVEQIKKSRAEQ